MDKHTSRMVENVLCLCYGPCVYKASYPWEKKHTQLFFNVSMATISCKHITTFVGQSSYSPFGLYGPSVVLYILYLTLCMIGIHSHRYLPKVLRAQHLGVEHDFALVRGDLQGGQHVVHSGQVGGRAGRHVVELPLQDVETRPTRDMGALKRGGIQSVMLGTDKQTQLKHKA